MQKPANYKQGFTLVEVAVMVGVVTVLAALVYGGIGNAQRETRNRTMIANASAYKSAYKAYRTVNNKYPTQSVNDDNNTTCLGSGYKDVTGDSVGDCGYLAAPASEDSQVTNQLRTQVSGGSLPLSTTKVKHPTKGDGVGGYFSSVTSQALTVDGKSRKYYISYFLEGYNQDCKIADSVQISGWPSATGWPNGTVNNARNAQTWTQNGGGTLCITLLPG